MYPDVTQTEVQSSVEVRDTIEDEDQRALEGREGSHQEV